MSTIAHEIHHILINILFEEVNKENLTLEGLFYLYISGEGLAVKYCNNAEGVLSKPIEDGPVNIGLHQPSWDYLNNDFDDTFKIFKEMLGDIESGKIDSEEKLLKVIETYWYNPSVPDEMKEELPVLLQTRIYTFGNDLWSI